MMIFLTDRAAEKIRGLFERHQLSDEACLRVLRGGCGCAGYSLGVAPAPDANDEVCESNGIRIACDRELAAKVDGTEIDFDGKLLGKGFVIHNPHDPCGCECRA